MEIEGELKHPLNEPIIFYHTPAGEVITKSKEEIVFMVRGQPTGPIHLSMNTQRAALGEIDWTKCEVDISDDPWSPTRFYVLPNGEITARLFVADGNVAGIGDLPNVNVIHNGVRLQGYVNEYEIMEALFVRDNKLVRYLGFHARIIEPGNPALVDVYDGGTTRIPGAKRRRKRLFLNSTDFLPRDGGLTAVADDSLEGALFIESSYAESIELQIVKFPVIY